MLKLSYQLSKLFQLCLLKIQLQTQDNFLLFFSFYYLLLISYYSSLISYYLYNSIRVSWRWLRLFLKLLQNFFTRLFQNYLMLITYYLLLLFILQKQTKNYKINLTYFLSKQRRRQKLSNKTCLFFPFQILLFLQRLQALFLHQYFEAVERSVLIIEFNLCIV